MPKELSIVADFVTEVSINNIRTLVVFNVKEHNADEFETGEAISATNITDESGDWVYRNELVFLKSSHSSQLPQHMMIELVTKPGQN